MTVPDREKAILTHILPNYGLKVSSSEQKYKVILDSGKGGFSNRFAAAIPQDTEGGLWNLYVALDDSRSAAARLFDAAGNHKRLGGMLGIPECCRNFYASKIRQAARKQGDLVPFTRRNTTGDPPFDYWTNYAAQYFGFSLSVSRLAHLPADKPPLSHDKPTTSFET